ncbi:hypothetical protein ACHHYP_13999, partial [Achlya hypogyna]
MLRALPHLGIPLPSGDTLTGIYFADDSTLLSYDLPSAVEQLGVVQEFCDASGARLNLPKCKTLVLNEHLDPADIDDGGLLRVLASGEPVKFLGVLFGHALPPDHQVHQLNTRFLACFQQWGCRARTIQGRRLLVNTVMLSLLWHVTAVVPVPTAMVAQWQSMVSKNILARKTGSTDRYRPLLPQRWQYDPQVGLGVPHIASKLRTQRLLRLQRLLQGTTAASPPWQELVLRQYARTMGMLSRPSHPFDFLAYAPHHRSTWLHLWELHPLWRDVWSHWASTSPSKRTQVPPSLATALAQPMWLTSDPLFVTDDLQCAGRLANTLDARRWCLHGANNGIRCLGDLI